jgi:hypothetical protein
LKPSGTVREGAVRLLRAAHRRAVSASKQVIYDGLKLALIKGVPREAAGILVDEQYGAAILRDARANGLVTCAPAEKSGQEEFQFEYGDSYAEHIADFKPTFVKVLVRNNRESDEAMNRRQAARLRELAHFVHERGRHFLFELLVPMTHEQSDRLAVTSSGCEPSRTRVRDDCDGRIGSATDRRTGYLEIGSIADIRATRGVTEVSEVALHFRLRPPPRGDPGRPAERALWPDPNRDAHWPLCPLKLNDADQGELDIPTWPARREASNPSRSYG